MHPYKILLLSFLLGSRLVAQERVNSDFLKVQNIQEQGFELQWDTSIAKIDALTIQAIESRDTLEYLVSNKNSFVFNDGKPACIYKIDAIQIKENTPSLVYSGHFVTKSLSSGNIKVYFNHIVDTSKANNVHAVNVETNLADTLIAYINRVQSTLDIAIYNSQSPDSSSGIAGAINAAYNRGVAVRVIYDGSSSSNMIALLNPAIKTLASPSNINYGLMHNKFVIMDANSSDPLAPIVWTGSTNWTNVQINGPDKNNVIILQDQSLALAYKTEFEEMWGSTTLTPNTSVSKFGQYKTDNTPHSFNIGGTQVESYFSPTDGVTEKIIAAIHTANYSINIAIMVMTRDDLAIALINEHTTERLPSINICMDTQNPSGNEFPILSANLAPNAVVKYAGPGIMHHKFMIVDHNLPNHDPLVLTGSHNWSASAETLNDENTLVIHDLDIADQYYQAFYYLFDYASGVIEIGIEETSKDENFVIYPNPTNHFLNLSFKNKMTSPQEIIIYNELGAMVSTTPVQDANAITSIDIQNLTNGLYLLVIKTEGHTNTKKFFVNR